MANAMPKYNVNTKEVIFKSIVVDTFHSSVPLFLSLKVFLCPSFLSLCPNYLPKQFFFIKKGIMQPRHLNPEKT